MNTCASTGFAALEVIETAPDQLPECEGYRRRRRAATADTARARATATIAAT
jgi:hypothetical protein